MGGQPSSGHFGPNNILGCWFARDNLDGSLYFNTNVDSYGECGRSYGNGIASCICRVWALWLTVKANFPCAPSPSPSKIQFNPSHMRHPLVHVPRSFLSFQYFFSFCLITFWEKNEHRHKPLFSLSQLLFVWHATFKVTYSLFTYRSCIEQVFEIWQILAEIWRTMSVQTLYENYSMLTNAECTGY